MPKDWEAGFPNLGSWIESSEATTDYNCAAFAAGDQSSWWDPFPPGLYHWPSGIDRDYRLPTFVELYRTLGFEPCADGSLQPTQEKIVIYANAYGTVEHVARQLPDGKWTSKMGPAEDIIHETPASLAGGDYGGPACFMARAIEVTLVP